MEQVSIPKWIAWEVTGKCNLNCVHCRSASDMDSSEGIWNTSRARTFLDELATYCQPVIVLTGGEPLLRKDIFEIVEYGVEKGFRMCLATNGTLVTDEICESIKSSGLRIVSLSLDGATAKTHDNFRSQEGAFDSTIKAAHLLKKHGIEFIINSSFTKRNQEEIPEIYSLAKKLGATAWYMFMIVPTGRGEELMEELIDKDEYEELLEWHFDMEQEETEMLVRPTCAPQYYRVAIQRARDKGIDYERRNLKFSTGGGKGCIAGQVICLVDHRGDVKPCSYFLRAAGNLQDLSFKEIWEESTIMKDMRDFKAYKGRCGSCEFLHVCGGCRARADAIHDDYMQEEPFCAHIPKRLRESEKQDG